MKQKVFFAEFISYLLCLIFFYDGIYKIAYWHNYATWMRHAPFIKPVWMPLTYFIPVAQIVLAVRVVMERYKVQSFYYMAAFSILFLVWLMLSILFSEKVFFPFHNIFVHVLTWREKFGFALVESWLAFIGIVLMKGKLIAEQPSDSIITKSNALTEDKALLHK